MEQSPQEDQRELTVEERQAVALGLINAARNAIKNGEPVNTEGLDPLVHGSETVAYVKLLQRTGVAALLNEHHTL